MPWIKTSLRTKIAFSFLLALIPVLLVVTLSVEFLLVPSIRQSVMEELSNSTRVLTNTVRANAAVTIRNHLKGIAERNLDIAKYHMSQVEQGLLSIDEAKHRLQNIITSQQVGTSGYIYCLDSKGNVPVHPNPEVVDTNVLDFAFVQDQVRKKNGYLEYYWKNPGEEKARAKALYMVYFPKLDWIISVSSYKEEFNQLLDPNDLNSTVSSLRFGESGYAYVINDQGDILIHPSHKGYNLFAQNEVSTDFFVQMLYQEFGIIRYQWRSPNEKELRGKIAVFNKLPEYGWMIVSSAYLEEVMRPVLLVRLVAHGSMVLLFFGLGLVSYYLSGRIVRPVTEMITHLDSNSRHATNEKLNVTSDDELGRLGHEFNGYIEMVESQRQDIEKQQKRYRRLFDTSPDAILLLRGNTIIDCNPTAPLLFDAKREEIIDADISTFIPSWHDADLGSGKLQGKELTTPGQSHERSFECAHYCTRTGREFTAEVILRPFEEHHEEPLLVGFLTDITERKQAEDALKKSELKYRQLIDNATDAIFIIQEEKIAFANSKTVELSGYSMEELREFSLAKLLHAEDVPRIFEDEQKNEKNDSAVKTRTLRFITKDGSTMNGQVSTVAIEWNDKPGTLNFVRDVTKLMHMEAVLVEAQKMESIGTLAGGIAHDFNNILMGIQGRISILLTEQGRDSKTHLLAIEEYIASASGLTRQLLGFARGGKYDPRPMDINALVRKSTEMFARTNKDLHFTIKTHRLPVVLEVDKPQLEQVLLNILVNAAQAMPGGGKIFVSTETIYLDHDFSRPYQIQAGDYGVIKITDTGIGMTAEVCKQAFDPFFTTKDKERGTGLGLASAYGIIQNHKGAISIDSRLGEGSSFTIYLPLATDDAIQDESDPENQIFTGDETILLVDDEEIIQDVGKTMLETLGYQVLIAKGGREALQILNDESIHLDLIILDLVMPDLDGEKTLSLIREHDPLIPVILSSGYTADGNASELLRKRICNDFIQKPFKLSDLSHRLRMVINPGKV